MSDPFGSVPNNNDLRCNLSTLIGVTNEGYFYFQYKDMQIYTEGHVVVKYMPDGSIKFCVGNISSELVSRVIPDEYEHIRQRMLRSIRHNLSDL